MNLFAVVWNKTNTKFYVCCKNEIIFLDWQLNSHQNLACNSWFRWNCIILKTQNLIDSNCLNPDYCSR